jgi:hypothetical protein
MLAVFGAPSLNLDKKILNPQLRSRNQVDKDWFPLVGSEHRTKPKAQLRFHNPLEVINVEGVALQVDEKMQISVLPAVLPENVGWVRVTWENVEAPSSKDWIAV